MDNIIIVLEHNKFQEIMWVRIYLKKFITQKKEKKFQMKINHKVVYAK